MLTRISTKDRLQKRVVHERNNSICCTAWLSSAMARKLCALILHRSPTLEVESSRPHFEVLGLGLEGQVLGLEASSPRKLACPRLEDSTIFWIVKILWSAWKIFEKRFFVEIAWKIFVKTFFFFFFFWRSPKTFLWRPFFFVFLESTCACVLGHGLEHSCPWPRECLSSERLSLALASDFFCVLWPWPRALCPRLHLCPTHIFCSCSTAVWFYFSGIVCRWSSIYQPVQPPPYLM